MPDFPNREYLPWNTEFQTEPNSEPLLNKYVG